MQVYWLRSVIENEETYSGAVSLTDNENVFINIIDIVNQLNISQPEAQITGDERTRPPQNLGWGGRQCDPSPPPQILTKTLFWFHDLINISVDQL